MTNQPEAPSSPPQPSDKFVIKTMREELAAVQDNRLYLLSALAEIQHEALAEIGRINSLFPSVLSLVEDEESRDKIRIFLADQQIPGFAPNEPTEV
jgi:hypothetical protein